MLPVGQGQQEVAGDEAGALRAAGAGRRRAAASRDRRDGSARRARGAEAVLGPRAGAVGGEAGALGCGRFLGDGAVLQEEALGRGAPAAGTGGGSRRVQERGGAAGLELAAHGAGRQRQLRRRRAGATLSRSQRARSRTGAALAWERAKAARRALPSSAGDSLQIRCRQRGRARVVQCRAGWRASPLRRAFLDGERPLQATARTICRRACQTPGSSSKFPVTQGKWAGSPGAPPRASTPFRTKRRGEGKEKGAGEEGALLPWAAGLLRTEEEGAPRGAERAQGRLQTPQPVR